MCVGEMVDVEWMCRCPCGDSHPYPDFSLGVDPPLPPNFLHSFLPSLPYALPDFQSLPLRSCALDNSLELLNDLLVG